MEEERLVRLQREFDALGGVCCGAADPYEVAVPAEDGVPLRTVVTLPDAAGPCRENWPGSVDIAPRFR